MTASMLFALCFLIGGVTGLRSMTGIALVCWGAHLGWLNLQGTRLSFLTSVVSLIVFSVFALGEFVADKLPVPPRITPGPLGVRIIFGALCAAALAIAAGARIAVPVVLGAIGAVAGAFAGYSVRRVVAARVGKDLPVALAEDALTILLGLFTVSRF